MGIYISAMINCYETLQQKQKKRYQQYLAYKDFDYFCFHTPFAKMVQKSFLSLLEHDIKKKPANHSPKLFAGIHEIS